MINETIKQRLFRSNLELLPQMNEIYELELAFAEAEELSDVELIQRGAYFGRVNNQYTHHFRMCTGEALLIPNEHSLARRHFFERNQFRTGYGTHGLFPYRGKFHPQMIKGLLNIMKLKPSETVLDPMMGSGTVLIEASLMGINSIGIDASPFCQFMVEAKAIGLSVPIEPLRLALKHNSNLLTHFSSRAQSQPTIGSNGSLTNEPQDSSLPRELRIPSVYQFLLLAFLDSAGYSQRSSRHSPEQQFRQVTERYLFVTEKIQKVINELGLVTGGITATSGDARNLTFESESIDGILFSPPYSFAVDYVENDSFHLSYLGVDETALRQKMIGLRGRTQREKFEHYKEDMRAALSECARVLRPGRFCTIIIGTNRNQLGKLMNLSPQSVPGLDELMIDLSGQVGMSLEHQLTRQIIGISNTMRNEEILLFKKR